MAMKKPCFSLPSALVHDLDYVARRLCISRSALLSELLSETIASLRAVLEDVPENPTESDLIRCRGRSIALVTERVQNLQGMEHDLFGN